MPVLFERIEEEDIIWNKMKLALETEYQSISPVAVVRGLDYATVKIFMRPANFSFRYMYMYVQIYLFVCLIWFFTSHQHSLS